MRTVELRSDTFTLPTPAMRAAMAGAPVGNDDYQEDPTVRRLEGMAAERLGMEAACLMPSGTMANLVAILSHAARGTRAVVGRESDIYLYEAAGASVCGGVAYEPVGNLPDGRFAPAELAAAFPADPDDAQLAPVGLVCLENPHNRCGGAVLDLGYQRDVAEFARGHGVPVHLDGARIFNASVATGVPVERISAAADSVQFCLSKGLAAPVGSVLAGPGGFVSRARRIRKMLGGTMRQAGVIAAAGIVALSEMVDRLGEDHNHARRLAEGLAGIPGISVDPAAVVTNVVLFRVTDERYTPESFVAAARAVGVMLLAFGHDRLRAVTHAGVRGEDVELALTRLERLLDGAGDGTGAVAGGPAGDGREWTGVRR